MHESEIVCQLHELGWETDGIEGQETTSTAMTRPSSWMGLPSSGGVAPQYSIFNHQTYYLTVVPNGSVETYIWC